MYSPEFAAIPNPGDIVGGRYQIVSVIGRGGGGIVYKATELGISRYVALKVLPASVAGDADRLARFVREAQLLASLNHPHIVTIHSVEEVEGVEVNVCWDMS